jgi:hypothetical protein
MKIRWMILFFPMVSVIVLSLAVRPIEPQPATMAVVSDGAPVLPNPPLATPGS